MAELDLGECPFIVYDEKTAEKAGEWAQQQALEILKLLEIMRRANG